jgi:ketosteroid isomerase-like protein
LNARLVRAYRSRDPQAYAALYTDTAVFEWPAFNTVRGPAALAAMARSNWASLSEMDLRLTVSTRRVASGQATELGAFEQSWRDTSGARMTEFGRYAAVLLRQADGSWRMDRFLGFADSTRPASSRP